MAERGELPGIVLRLSVLLLLLGFASVQLQGWASRNSVGYGSLQARLQRLGRSARRVKHVSVVYEKVEGQEIPGRIQCRDDSWRNRSIPNMETNRLARDRPCMLSKEETVSFVTLFVMPEVETASDRFSEAVEKKFEVRKVKKSRQDAVLRAFLESIQVSMPGTTRVTIITNHNKLRGELPQDIDWKPTSRHFSRRNLMIQRLQSYIELLDSMIEDRKNNSSSPVSHAIFSDFDMIVVDDLGCVFKEFPHFDIAFTFRNNQRQPINSGVIMVRGTFGSLSRATQLLKEVVKIYLAKFRHAFGVLGDQLALADIVKGTLQARAFQEGVPVEATVMTTKTLFLPCVIYNWTPPEGAGQFQGMPTEVKVLHFKGRRKRLMIQAWYFYKKQGVLDFYKMKCLVLKSGRSKYDY
ncbi:uncharacterized protein [Physcomitrium patens]|uniref:Nucleotide-diphospho-sugar transferase domain-containing protein n=2 Tax=Physcomitrium patens TaxID=3218 RepID=A0A7I4BDA8_PHYPA|nr:uncharacterized protein LOC112294389 isoform X1 [Physcomitrium patens]|eukprot:XP_024400488.1 uncharacterized protein LOC112294389 isoform X1 [Physcomitrella patens]